MNPVTRNTLLMAVLLVGLVVWWLFNRPRQTTLNPRETTLAVHDTAAIRQVRLLRFSHKKETGRLVLERTPAGWRVNGQYDARPDKIELLLTALRRLAVREPLHPNARSTVFGYLDENHIRVEVDGPEPRTFFVGEQAAVGQGSYLLVQGAKNPVIAHLPGMTPYLKPYFSTFVNDWRDNRIFALNPREIYRLEVDAGPLGRFAIDQRPGSVALVGFPQADTARLHRYLERYRSVPARGFGAREYPTVRDSLARRPPDASIALRDRQGYVRRLVLYNRQDDINTRFGWVEGEDELLIVQHFVLDSLLVPPTWFLGR
jgi:hypothetical protein